MGKGCSWGRPGPPEALTEEPQRGGEAAVSFFWTKGPKGLPKAGGPVGAPETPRPARVLRPCPMDGLPAGAGSRAQGWFSAPGTCPVPSHRCYPSSLPAKPSQPSKPSAPGCS